MTNRKHTQSHAATHAPTLSSSRPFLCAFTLRASLSSAQRLPVLRIHAVLPAQPRAPNSLQMQIAHRRRIRTRLASLGLRQHHKREHLQPLPPPTLTLSCTRTFARAQNQRVTSLPNFRPCALPPFSDRAPIAQPRKCSAIIRTNSHTFSVGVASLSRVCKTCAAPTSQRLM